MAVSAEETLGVPFFRMVTLEVVWGEGGRGVSLFRKVILDVFLVGVAGAQPTTNKTRIKPIDKPVFFILFYEFDGLHIHIAGLTDQSKTEDHTHCLDFLSVIDRCDVIQHGVFHSQGEFHP